MWKIPYKGQVTETLLNEKTISRHFQSFLKFVILCHNPILISVNFGHTQVIHSLNSKTNVYIAIFDHCPQDPTHFLSVRYDVPPVKHWENRNFKIFDVFLIELPYQRALLHLYSPKKWSMWVQAWVNRKKSKESIWACLGFQKVLKIICMVVCQITKTNYRRGSRINLTVNHGIVSFSLYLK